jgi:hypothetical protein
MEVAHHARVGDQLVRRHHQIHGGRRDGGMRLAAVPDAGPPAALRLRDTKLAHLRTPIALVRVGLSPW